jgi:outer membrane protein TolC
MLFISKSRKILHPFIFVLLIMSLSGCTTYSPMPLDRAAVSKRLTPPSMETIRIKAAEIKHPILKPIEIKDQNGLSPDEAAVIAVIANPRLRAVRDGRRIVTAQLLQAGILPNPQFAYSLDIPTGGNTKGTVDAFGLSLSWDPVALVTRGTRMEAARDHIASVDLDVAWQEWQVAEAAKLHVYRLILLEKELDIAEEGEKGLQHNLEAVKQAVNLGDMTAIDLSAAEAALRTVRLSVLGTEKQHEKERLALNQTLGFPPETKNTLQADIKLPRLKKIPTLAEIMEGMEERRLDLLALKKGYRSQEARLRAAILAQFPRINIGFSESRDNTDVVSTGFSISLGLPFFDRNQGQIAIEQATREKLFDEYLQRLFQARSDLAVILADIASIQRQIDATESFIRALNSLVQTYYEALLEGNADVLSYYNARNNLISKQIEAINLKQTLMDQVIALEIAAGRYLELTETGEVSS